MTSGVGAPLLDQADRGVGLTGWLVECFTDLRRAAPIAHAVATLVARG